MLALWSRSLGCGVFEFRAYDLGVSSLGIRSLELMV